MPHVRHKLHLGRRKRIVLGEPQLRGEHTAFKWRAFGPLDQRFPHKHVVFVYGARRDALGWVVEKCLVLFEEPLGSRRRHCSLVVAGRGSGERRGRCGVYADVLFFLLRRYGVGKPEWRDGV